MSRASRSLTWVCSLPIAVAALTGCDDGDPSGVCDYVTCSDHGQCVVGAGGTASCECDDGYVADGVRCVVAVADADADADADGDTDADADGDADQQCDDGYEPSGGECVDVDECDVGTDDCDANATCTNTEGSFECECIAGYEGDGTACADVDECDVGTDDCDANATCTNTEGSFECECNEGYEGDGTACTDVDECLDPAVCGEGGICTNEPGSFSCACGPCTADDGTGRCQRLERCGQVVLIGHDYYEATAEANTIVGNAIFNLPPTRGTVNVLAYTQHADLAEEVAHTNEAIDARATELGRAWSRTDLTDSTLLGAMLPGNDVLLIYEQESAFGTDYAAVGAAWAGILREFVAGGGVVVACDFVSPVGASQVLAGARLMDISASTFVPDGSTLTIVDAASPLVEGIAGPTYAASNGTSSFATSSEGAVVTTDAGAPVVIHRVLSRGGDDFYAVPYDYYQWDAAGAALLQRAVTYGFSATPSVGVVRRCVDTTWEVDPTNPTGPYDQGEYYASIAALEFAGFPASHVVEIVDAADAASLAGMYDVLLFPEQEACTESGAEWVAVISELVAVGGRVVAMGWTSEFINDLGMFGTGSSSIVMPGSTFLPSLDPFWSGIAHPGWLDATWTWTWSGAGLTALGSLSTDATALTVWGYSVD